MRPLMPPVQTPDNLFHDGNPLTGELGTIVDAEHLNNEQAAIRDTQSELIAILTAAAMEPESTAGQLLAALNKLYAPLNDTLGALSSLVGGANKLPYFTSANAAALTALSGIGRDIVGKATVADVLTYLGLGEMPIIAKYGSALIGELVHWPMQQMPQEIWTDMKMEFIPYMGQSFDGSKYPLLAQLHPSLQLPADMRGEFVRGWDNGRGINTGQQLMSWSADSFKSHTHTPTNGSFFTYVATGGGQLVNGSNNPNVAIVPTTNSVGGAETRPRSVTWNFIVRAK